MDGLRGMGYLQPYPYIKPISVLSPGQATSTLIPTPRAAFSLCPDPTDSDYLLHLFDGIEMPERPEVLAQLWGFVLQCESTTRQI